MPSSHTLKKHFLSLLSQPDWRAHIFEIVQAGQAAIGPLFSLLPLEPEIRHRAAVALGACVAKIAETDPEKAYNIVRRFMWHMSEESGNIGWGIPEAFAETLAASPKLAEKYRNILVSYIIDLGHDDNYCDNDILRRSCYWAIGRFAQTHPQLAEKARPWLLKGLEDEDSLCRGLAAWALGCLGSQLNEAPALKRLAASNNLDQVSLFDNDRLISKTVFELAKEALQKQSKP